MYLGQNAFFTVQAQEQPASMRLVESAMATVLPSGEVSPDCPPFDCSICPVQTVTVKEKVEVPGPTQVVYRDRYITQPGTVAPGAIVRIPAASAPESGGISPTPTRQELQQWYISQGLEVPASLGPEDTEMYDGEIQTHEVKKFPWMLLVAGGAAAWFLTRKK
jgi:hypothetical protein